jgi:D-serine deaminase-like pyridoxal phosphate-dependent protein
MTNEIGMKVHEVSTPAVAVDLDKVERNLSRMATYCNAHNLKLRPHTKTHKTVEAAKMQLALGAVGLTVAKVGEAEVMAMSGTREILVAHPIVGNEKIQRLAAMAKDVRVIVAVDSLQAAEGLARVANSYGVEFDVLVEFDSGSKRCGVTAGADAAALGKLLTSLRGIHLRGLFTYFGSVWGNETERAKEMELARADVSASISAYRAAGLSTEIVSAGSTPGAEMSHLIEGITEIRPGTYIYNDLNTYYQGLCSLDDCAVRVITTVVSTAVPGQIIVDAGSKTLSSDLLSAGPKSGYGKLMGHEGVLEKLNEEHGYVAADDLASFEVGQIFTVIPNHVCTCINMHDEVLLIRKGEVVGKWHVAARGKVR